MVLRWFATLSKTIVDEPATDEITDEISVGKAISIELTETLSLKIENELKKLCLHVIDFFNYVGSYDNSIISC